MTQGTEPETNPSVWRYLAARLKLQRAILDEQNAELRGKRERAQQRAKAAEMIAYEANAERLQTLLDAAREQATVRPIESAERRFADAKDEWEAAQPPFERDADDEPFVPDEARPDTASYPAGSLMLAATLRRRVGPGRSVRAGLAGVACLAVVLVAGIYLYPDTGNGAGETAIKARDRAAAPSKVAAVAQAAPASSIETAKAPAELPPRSDPAAAGAVATAAPKVTKPPTAHVKEIPQPPAPQEKPAASPSTAPVPLPVETPTPTASVRNGADAAAAAEAAKPATEHANEMARPVAAIAQPAPETAPSADRTDRAPAARLAAAPSDPTARWAAPSPPPRRAWAPTPARNPFRVAAPEPPPAPDPAPPASSFLPALPE